METQIIISPNDSMKHIKRMSVHSRGRWWYAMPDNPNKLLPIKRRGRYWEYSVPSISGIELQREDFLYNALVDIHLCKATIYNTK